MDEGRVWVGVCLSRGVSGGGGGSYIRSHGQLLGFWICFVLFCFVLFGEDGMLEAGEKRRGAEETGRMRIRRQF
jgi:hypothetical protein